ncbi:cytochrome c oxidase subunit 3 [Thalassobellus sediminis]|uniref:cytochrome c oxidase subunit 3 n=1 Tax=Thalassobellus sediminis TaxID=3367753 RepID=UPI00378BA7F9
MDLTQGTSEEKNSRAKKMMLWFSLISLFMAFAGLTSAVIISRNRPDWATELELPNIFLISVFVVLLSSLTFIFAKQALIKENRSLTSLLLISTLGLGVLFVFLQFAGFEALIEAGYRFTGEISNPKSSFIFLIAFFHVLHVVAGLICILVVIYNHFKQKYSAIKILGFELAATFWHFVGILWVFLYLLLRFVG